jgi:hypothetical protein
MSEPARGWMKRARAGLVALLVCIALAACAAGPPVTTPRTGTGRAADLMVPPGHGSLVQDEITLTVRTEQLLLKVTPLEEWVLRLTAPDTYARLSALASSHRTEVVRRTGVTAPSLFLVSFFGRTAGATFRPEDVQVVTRGRRLRPLLVREMTAGWGEGRVDPEHTQAAVYAFPEEVDLEQSFGVEYGTEPSSTWEQIRQRLEAERGRARARAGLGRD